MSEDHAARRGRVERVVAAGARLADPGDPLGDEARRRLPESSGLSPEGVELALTRHLETRVASAALDALVAASGRARRCQVVLSANVCTAPLRAIAVATATAPEVVVRPSRRDPVVAELLARALQDDARFAAQGGRVAIAHELSFLAPADAERPGDAAPDEELHVYGTDETVAALRAKAGARAIVRGHGAGLGVAIVGAAAEIGAAARALADDVIPFDQRGCLSPRFALVEGPAARGEAFARALHEALARGGAEVPRGPQDRVVAEEVAMYRATLAAVGVYLEGDGHGVGFDPAPRALLLPPAARVVHVAACSAEGAEPLLAAFRRAIVAVGGSGGALAQAARRLAPRARRSELGQMQRPPLDGPVDLRPA